jgi:hypothetical protein
MVGLLRIVGLHVPQPEIAADESNPKGFGEPQWVVEHHERLLRKALVQVSDSRPDAWEATGRLAERAREQQRAQDWLAGHLADHPHLVVKDPRLSWFLPMWRAAAGGAGATPAFVTMLRPPAEVVGSKQNYYANRLGAAHLAASWLNMLLHTELGTRGAAGGRVFVRYADLLTDWAGSVARVGEALGRPELAAPTAEQAAEASGFVDPSLRRMNQQLDELALPARLHELVAEAWTALDGLAEPGGDTVAAQPVLDQIRAAYVELYQESEAVSRSSVVAARFELRQEIEALRAVAEELEPMSASARGADRIPHEIRAMVPPRVRRAIRRIVPRSR